MLFNTANANKNTGSKKKLKGIRNNCKLFFSIMFITLHKYKLSFKRILHIYLKMVFKIFYHKNNLIRTFIH